jgi:sulfonate transport system substrate-binding protein
MMRQLVTLLIVATLAVILFPIGGLASEKVDKIVITYVKLPLNVPSILAKQLGLFEKEFGRDGIAVEWPELTAGPKQTQAMAAGSVQFASVLGSDSGILGKANGVDLKVIAAYSRAPKAFNIMARNPSIRTVSDLRGKIIVGPKGTLLHRLLIAALKKNGLKPADVKFVNMAIPQAQAAVLSGSADAALIAGPTQIKAEESGARVIAGGSHLISGLIVIAVSGPFLKEHPDLVDRYLKVHKQSLDYFKAHPSESIKRVARETEISEGDVKRMLPWYDFNPAITDGDMADLAATQAFLLENKMLTTPIRIRDLIAGIH